MFYRHIPVQQHILNTYSKVEVIDEEKKKIKN